MLDNQEPLIPLLIQDLGFIKEGIKKVINRPYGLFKCYCGVEFKTQIRFIKSGHTKSCGCLQIRKVKLLNTSHNKSGTRQYNTWCHMINRTENKASKDYKWYGGRGITVCSEWRNDFMSFYDWAISNGYHKSLSIDRIDVNGNYDPSNCRWVTQSDQMINTTLIHKNNTTGHRGVSYNKKDKKYYANITQNNVLIFSKTFDSIEEASIARDNFIIANNIPHQLNKKDLHGIN